MRFAGQPTNGANRDRAQTTVKALTVALMALLATAAADACAESAMLANYGGQGVAPARIGITIVIPAVLILDRRTGTFYTNDARAYVSLGTMGAPRYTIGVDRDVSAQTALRPLSAINGGRAGHGQIQGRGTGGITGHTLHDGEVICIP